MAIKKKYFYFLLVAALGFIFIIYFPVMYSFFQHDEWIGFSHFFSGSESFLTYFRPYVSHYTPLSRLFFSLYILIFKLNFSWYALSSIFNHIIVVFLAFLFFSELFKNPKLGLLSSIFFALGASGHQATSWVGTDINIHGSTIFGLLALLILVKSNYEKIWMAIIFLIISLLFKETTIAFFVILPLMVYIFENRNFLVNRLKYLKFLVIGSLYLFLRFLMIFSQRANIEDRLVIETQSFFDIAANLVTFPAKIFAQTLIPIGLLLSLSKSLTKILPKSITGLYGTTAFDVFTENVTLQVLNWAIFLLGIFFLIFIIKRSKNELIKKTAMFGFLFAFLNSFIYVLSPGRSGSIPVVDSRNIYLPSLGSALFFISIVYALSKEKIIKAFLVILPLLVLNVFWLEKELFFLADRGTERKKILYQIKNTYPILPNKVIFYMVSDKSFYGFPENIKMLPFEVNLGYTLMNWYQDTENLPSEFFNLSYIYQLTDEGYREVGSRGFGYVRNWNSLITTVRSNNLNTESIIAFSYNSATKSVEDITTQIREKVEKGNPGGV